MVDQCSAVNRNGSRCRGTALPAKAHCFAHDPELAQTRAEASVRGGQNKATQKRARRAVLAAGMELPDVDAALCKAMVDVLNGSLEPTIGTAAATIARTIVTVRQVAHLEARISALEERSWHGSSNEWEQSG